MRTLTLDVNGLVVEGFATCERALKVPTAADGNTRGGTCPPTCQTCPCSGVDCP